MKWLRRDLIVGPYLALALSEADFHKAMGHCKVPQKEWPEWVKDGADATAHVLTNPDGGTVSIVCMRTYPNITPIQIAGILVHEAVHVWQHFCKRIGEDDPSFEFEAYSIQSIAQALMQAYADSIK